MSAAGSGPIARRLRVTVLGSGTSAGVPVIGCDCEVCHSPDPRDRRTRPSILVEIAAPGPSPFAAATRHLLVDTSTDLRAQALANGMRRIDAILFTHAHADHILGLDDVRSFNILQGGPIAGFGDGHTLAHLRRSFGYVFGPPSQIGGGVPQVTAFRIAGPFSLGGIEIVPVPIWHGSREILGFRFGTFAYLTDCSTIPDASWALLDGVDTLMLDALRDEPHPTHMTVPQALAVVTRVSPTRAYFTHMTHDLPHAATCARLPANVELAYDGLVFDA